MIVLLALVAAETNPSLPAGAVLLFAWFIIRLLPLALLAQTPGQTLAGYEVRGPGGARLGPLRAALRDLLMVANLSWVSLSAWWPNSTPGPFADPDSGLDRRWPHDRLTDSWVMRRDALTAPG